MAQGRGNAYAAAMLLIILGLQSWRLASAATYTVGDSKGWTIGVDYSTWAAGLTFKAGDILFFPYSQTEHNVVVVDKAGYDACSDANAITTYSEGNTNVTLTTGTHYYLCSVVGHCSAGMKLAVTVTATATTPAPAASPPATVTAPAASPPASAPATVTAPTASPPASAPAPSKTPSSSPITTPSTAPSPTSPSSAPAPASVPSPSSPASAPTVGAPASLPSAPGSTPSSAGTPPSPPPPPNAAPSLLVSATFAPVLTLLAALFAL